MARGGESLEAGKLSTGQPRVADRLGAIGGAEKGVAFTRTFSAVGDFRAVNEAEAFLEDLGFSVGSMQRGDPRGIMFGDYTIAKWRNLHSGHKRALHGTMTGSMREGPVCITIFESAPAEARSALSKAKGSA